MYIYVSVLVKFVTFDLYSVCGATARCVRLPDIVA